MPPMVLLIAVIVSAITAFAVSIFTNSFASVIGSIVIGGVVATAVWVVFGNNIKAFIATRQSQANDREEQK